MSIKQIPGMDIQRKYLTGGERNKFLIHSEKLPIEKKVLCIMLLETGCRITEALNLTWRQIDIEDECIYFETLKQRRKDVFRCVPISKELTRALTNFWGRAKVGDDLRLWQWSRMTAYRYVRATMKAARIEGPQASPKGLRHGFAVAALEAGAPLNLVQRWLGHARLETTMIYTHVVGAEERAFAEKVWKLTGSGRSAALAKAA